MHSFVFIKKVLHVSNGKRQGFWGHKALVRGWKKLFKQTRKYLWNIYMLLCHNVSIW